MNYAIIRWHKTEGMEFPSRCGPLSVCALAGGYGFPNRGSIGKLVLFVTREDADKAISDGQFDTRSTTNSHTVEPLNQIRFRITAGPWLLSAKRDVEFTGSYLECLEKAGAELLTGHDRNIQIVDTE